jgi:hypothetical protein
MHRAARSYVTAAALAAGSMIAITPGMSVPDLQARDVKLSSSDGALASADDFLSNLIGPVGPAFADPLLALQAEELSANAGLVTGESSLNGDLIGAEESLLSSFGVDFTAPTGTTTAAAETVAVGAVSDPTAAFDRLLDANNLLLGTGENVFNSVLGADNFDPATINSELLLGGAAGTGPTPEVIADLAAGGGPDGGGNFVNGDIGGLQGVTGNDLAALSIALDGTLSGSVPTLASAFSTFDTDLINDELAFNANLLANEQLAATAAFGSNTALNGAVDRVINIDNLPLSTAENSFNSFIGADSVSAPAQFVEVAQPAGVTLPEEVTASLLTGSPTTVFDSGALGGAEGFADQNAALFADLAGLNSAEITSALAPGVFEPTLFSTAIGDLIDPTAFTNLAPDFSSIATDFSAVLTSLF